MKNLLAIFIIFSTMLIKQSEYISINHIGISDKPIATIVISKDRIGHSDVENFIVKSEDFFILKGLVLSDMKAGYRGSEFGSFRVTIRNTKGKDLCYCLNRQQSIQLFNKLIRTVEKEKPTNDELLVALKNLKKRIVF